MFITVILTLAMCATLFIMIWAAAAFHLLPQLATFMSEDIQEKIKCHKAPFKGAPVIGWIVIILARFGYIEILYMEYRRYIQALDCCKTTKAAKMSDFNRYVKYLSEHGISDISNTNHSMVYSYINDIQNKYSLKTMKTLKYSLRLLHDWLYSAGYLPYDGKMVFLWIQDVRRSWIPSY